MQSVSAAFTAEERDTVRDITQDLLVSWKKESTLGNRTFTIAVSTIGGNDIIGANPGSIGSPGNYSYFEESEYVKSLAWERGLNMPLGGLARGFAEAQIENTTGRFTPRYMGGSSELFTSILPRRPFIINAGFDFDGIPQNIPQFSGIFTRQPRVNARDKSVRVVGSDYIDFFENRYLDHELMFTGQRTDIVYEDILQSIGLSTSQYDLDAGINIIPFGLYDKGTRLSHIFNQLAEAENGHFYQDEMGIFKFENRQHWDNSPYDEVQRILLTGQVLEAEAPDEDHIINVVEIKGSYISKQHIQPILNYPLVGEIAANSTKEMLFQYDDPVLQVITPTNGGTDSYYIANTLSDGTGTDTTGSVTIKSIDNFSTASKIVFQNNSASTVYLTSVVISGRPAKKIADIYVRAKDGSSLTAFEERSTIIENPFIQDPTWANSYAQMLLNDYAEPENLQRIVTRAIPELQLGDLVSWQGRYWRVFHIRANLDPSAGFVQELTLLQRTPVSYFRIEISTIGGSDIIAP